MAVEKTKLLSGVSDALTKLATFITKHQPMINVCMVDFVTANVFENVLHSDLRNTLQQLTEDEICSLPQKVFSQEIQSTKTNHAQPLESLISELREHTLESMGVVETKRSLFDIIKSCTSENNLKHFDRFMSEKKMHEVVVMNEVVNNLCLTNNVNTLVDLGSGKAYLSQALTASCDNLRILAIDSSKVNSEGAKKRSDRLDRKWDSLKKRADLRAAGAEVPIRSKHRSKRKEEKKQNEENAGSSELATHNPLKSNLKYATHYVDAKTNLKTLLSENFSDIEQGNDAAKFNDSRLGLIGLHTCGNLAADSLKICMGNDSIVFCCNVGCCYHHIDEEFYRNPYLAPDETSHNVVPSFPLSSQLRKQSYELGRNARMIAAQPMDRLVENKQLPNEALLWRAVLQHILIIHVPNLDFKEQQVGRIATKCGTFIDYVHKAFQKLDLTLKMENQEVEDIYDKLAAKHRDQLNAFYQLRALFGPLIEGLILLDRLSYVLEQDCTSQAFLVKLFDPVISPRCYAIVAWKH